MFLLQMAGYPGSGKSTLSKKIAKRMGAIVIDRDIIKSSMIESNIPEDLLASASYNAVFALAKFYLGMRLDVIIDTPCYYEEIVNKGIFISAKYGATYKYIECRVEDYSIIEERINSRDILPSQFRTASIDSFNNCINKSVRPMDKNFLILIIDTSLENSYNMNLIEEYLIT